MEDNNNDHSRPIQVMDFDIATPIDVKKAIETLCGNPTMFYTMLSKFEDMTFLDLMGKISKAVENNDMINY
jgi:hypothetical protein